MFERRRIPLLLLSLAAALVCARAAHACSCAETPTVLDSFERSDVVVVARAVSVEKTERAAPKGKMPDGTNYVDGIKSTTMRVERVFKGNLKVGDEMTFAQGGGADCMWTFDEDSVGAQFLFYLRSPRQGGKVWIAGTCGRSNSVEGAADDMLYLDKLDKVRGKTRVSGQVSFENDRDIMSVAGRTLRIKGADKTRVFAAGMSSGGCMTNTLLAVYPDVFAGGSAMPGYPAGAWPSGDTQCQLCGSAPSSSQSKPASDR